MDAIELECYAVLIGNMWWDGRFNSMRQPRLTVSLTRAKLFEDKRKAEEAAFIVGGHAVVIKADVKGTV